MGLGSWLERRMPLGRWTREAVTEEIPGGASYWYIFGSATAIDFLVLAATGIWQVFYYVPSTDRAYDSVNFLRFQVPWGWLIHGLHYWAATAMVVLVMLHLAQAFIWGAFKKPRELTWVLGVVLLLATLGAMFTGSPLPWDKRGYLAAQVANGIAGSIPVLGGVLQRMVWGGQTVGQLSLSRFFTLHVAVIPIVLGAIILLHLIAFRIPGGAGPFSERRRQRAAGLFWPDQLLKDFIAFSLVFIALVGLSALLKTPVNGAADPLDATYIGKPEWPFLFLYQVLKFLPGSLEAVGVLLVPLLGLVLLFGVPWFDRSPERAPQRRPVALAVFAVVLVVLVVLSVLGAGGPTEIVSQPSGKASSVTATATAAPKQAPQATAAFTVGNAEHGRTLYVDFCQQCHGAGAKGSDTAPSLNPIDSSLVSPDPQTFAGNIDGIIQEGSADASGNVLMPAFGQTAAMTQPQIADVEAYVMSLNGADRAAIQQPGMDPRVFFALTAVVFGLAVAAGVFALAGLRRP